MVLGDHGEGEVHAGGDAGAGPEAAGADEDRVGVDLGLRVFGGEFGGEVPVRGGRPARQQAGRGEQQCAGADAADPGGPAGGGAQPVGDGGVDPGDGRAVGGVDGGAASRVSMPPPTRSSVRSACRRTPLEVVTGPGSAAAISTR
ncbi:hypothetical protein GCM10009663_11190 [Kitasatospora arboriphila]|uniref:Uncharacterized protein n=1 Tax=Kitasatospora arboriphila TaxID=258052 RepID=A0ABN1TBG7_9ACTN